MSWAWILLLGLLAWFVGGTALVLWWLKQLAKPHG